MSFDPCLNCRLPECDETARGCLLNHCATVRTRLYRAGEPVPDEITQGYHQWYRARRIDRAARQSEARS